MQADQREDLESEIEEVSKSIQKLSFSVELLARELYYYKDIRQEANQHYLKYSHNTLVQGQPLELIDGDNLQFMEDIKKTLHQYDNKDEDLLVVSVLGPQSAGKSLLMNTIFGAQFLSSAGRCTKGIYCSLLTYEHRGRKKNILILDTEGIQSANARDKYFDRRIVYFVLCVSHVVLFVNNGEMNSEMADVIMMVNEAVKNTEEEFIKNPSIFIILNKMSQVTFSTASDCVKILKDKQNKEE